MCVCVVAICWLPLHDQSLPPAMLGLGRFLSLKLVPAALSNMFNRAASIDKYLSASEIKVPTTHLRISSSHYLFIASSRYLLISLSHRHLMSVYTRDQLHTACSVRLLRS